MLANFSFLCNLTRMKIDISAKIDFIKATLKENQQAIVLTGLMGAGKSKVGKALAKALDISFIDSDEVIEKNHGTISDYFATFGEEKFRVLERSVIASFVQGDPKILSTGGGAFTQAETRQLVNDKAVSVWLNISPEDTMKRLGEKGIEKRPLLANAQEGPLSKLKSLYDERSGMYGAAHVHVHVTDEGSSSKEESIAQNRDRVINALYMHLKR